MMSNIKKRALGSTGLLVSEIGFGALEIGRDWAADVNADPRHLSAAEAGRVLNALLDRGINFIDTAPAYWYSEEFIGKGLAHRRSEYILATKAGEHCDPSGSVYDYSYDATVRFIDQSLQRLQTDYIDLLQIHSASMEVLERGETLGAMEEARRAGKVRHLGMTGGAAECERALEIGGYETVQFPYNLLNISAENRLFDLIREKNAGAILMRGIAGGKLTRKYQNLQNEPLKNAIAGFEQYAYPGGDDPLLDLAIGYVLARPEVSSVIIGSRRVEAMEQAIAAAARRENLSPDTLQRVAGYSRGLNVQAW
jgi:aryl-alcohol dehydrogenase-like predicted oxidoreductase